LAEQDDAEDDEESKSVSDDEVEDLGYHEEDLIMNEEDMI
jgi:hypothetical protein